ncbi:MAG TPA: hypothetical protein VJ843_02945 [Candidatus Saccharimonadales bacterium]|nr:hypothetical protein [Candidatus Saccharimonadales bacterium]
MNYRTTRRVVGATLVALLMAGATGCRTGQGSDGSSGSQQKQQGSEGHDGFVDPELVRCANLRAALNDMKPTKKERELTGDFQLKSSYKAMQKFYATFAWIFPKSASAANALSTIYAHAYSGTITKAEEAKIGGLETKTNKVIDKHCPNSSYPLG